MDLTKLLVIGALAGAAYFVLRREGVFGPVGGALPTVSKGPTGGGKGTGPSVRDQLEGAGIAVGAGAGCAAAGGGPACPLVGAVAGKELPKLATYLTKGTGLPKEAAYIAPGPVLVVRGLTAVFGGTESVQQKYDFWRLSNPLRPASANPYAAALTAQKVLDQQAKIAAQVNQLVAY